MAYMYGYKPKVTGLSNTIVDIYQQVPAKLVNNEYVPDYNYALYVDANTSIQTTSATSVTFTLDNPIDFTVSNSLDPTKFQLLNYQEVILLLSIKKIKKSFSGKINTTSFSVGAPQDFLH